MKRFSRFPVALVTALTALTGLSSSYAIGLAGPQAVAQTAAQAQGSSHYFPETKHTVMGKFWQYWQQHGGLAQQGYPISEQMQEKSDTDGKTYTVQYFERAVFELHPEKQAPYDVLLSLLGSMLYTQKHAGGAPGQAVNKEPRAQRFPETGKTVGGIFLDYWKTHGGLAQQGFPISEEFTEVSPLDGKSYKVQYFERAVFESHPEQKSPYNVLLSQLGTFRYQAIYARAKGGVDEAAAAFAQGVDAYNKADYDAAITAFGQAIRASSQFEQAYLNRAIANYAKGNSAGAQVDLDQAAAIQPGDITPLYVSGIVQYKLGNFAAATQAFSNMLQVNASDQRGYYWRANSYLSQNNTASALEDFGQATRLKPDSDLGRQAQTAINQLNGGGNVAAAQAPVLEVVQGQPPAPPAPPAPGGTGQLVSDLGFRPATDGFAFENYGAAPDRTNMTPDDMRRMFGDQVCASLANGCILTPQAQTWMDSKNRSMSGGHCEGFAALSLAFFQGKENATSFGAAKTHDLNINSNAALQREIAYFFATQYTRPVVDNVLGRDKSPSEILDTLTDALKPGSSALKTYTLGIYKPSFKDGHAITPYAVEDRGNGKFAIRVYDNNFPDTERFVLIDRNANTWSYEGSTNPSEPGSLYQGDANTRTLDLTPTEARLQKQVCDFCPGGAGGGGAEVVRGATSGYNIAQAPAQYNQVSLEGSGHLLITDKQGRRTGYVSDSQFVNEIPGMLVKPITRANLWKSDLEPLYFVPVGIEFSLALESTDPKNNTVSSVTMIGPGYDLSVEDIILEPNTVDTINFSADGKMLVYKTQYSDSPDIALGTNGKDADFAFDLKGLDLGNGGSVSARLDTDKGKLALDARSNTEAAIYSLTMHRIDNNGEQIFGHDKVELQPGDTAYLDYAQWKGDGTPLLLEVDHNSDGTIDQTIELSDVH